MSSLQTRDRRPADNGTAAIECGDLDGSQRIYSSQSGKASPDQVRMKYRIYRSLERLRRRKRKGEVDHPFRLELLRQREIESLIRHRYGSSLPEHDGDEFFRAIAHSIQAYGSERVFGALCDWCHRFAPWALSERYLPTLQEVAESVGGRTHDLRADAVANLLRVTMKERLALRLRTIGACDVTPAERKLLMREKKMESDRKRRRAEREIVGRKTREEYEKRSLSRLQPWEAAGMSRATWYRLPKEVRETSLSRVADSIGIGDTPVSSAQTGQDMGPAALAAVFGPKDRLPQSANADERREAKPKAQRSEASPQGGQRERMRASPAVLADINAAFDRIHDPNTRWLPVPGSATEMYAA